MINKTNNEKIDFVVLWVNDNDPKWLKKKAEYSPALDSDNGNSRYRDWDLFKYWFRGIERNAPWVNNIFLVTDHQAPDWLNTNHPKIKLINHEDYIDKKYLPLFNSSAIECTLCNINGLSNKFVLFNDDMFIINKTKSRDFFLNNLPRDEFAECPVRPNAGDTIFSHILINNTEIVNSHFNKKKNYIKQPFKYLNIKYGRNNLRTLSSLLYKEYIGFHNPHIPQAFDKKTWQNVYEKNKPVFELTLNNRFRSKTDITQYLIRYFQLASGNFIPRSSGFGRYFDINEKNIKKIIKHIVKRKTKTVCLNDNDDGNVENHKIAINEAFLKIFPEKSSFEK
ncbi:Stealth CR1 domain-containing protein [Candidatus Saccharibacteria bacterium]|nr:Stealth CR1 domain-containing protein [Candidatus Saccharibacteria bacterium]